MQLDGTMKIKQCTHTAKRYEEFPELLFATAADGMQYFDATHFLLRKGDPQRHNTRHFEALFTLWKQAACSAYEIRADEVIVKDRDSGHILIDESLALLFVVYIDPAFGVYLLERMSEMLLNGYVLSDSAIIIQARLRLTKETLTNIINNNE